MSILNVKAIRVFGRHITSDRDHVLIDLDDDEYEAFTAAILEGTEDDDPDSFWTTYNEIVDIIVNNRSKDIFLCSREAKGAKMKLFEDVVERLKEAAEKTIQSSKSTSTTVSLLNATLFEEQTIAGSEDMVRAKAHIIRNGEAVVIKVEYFR